SGSRNRTFPPILSTAIMPRALAIPCLTFRLLVSVDCSAPIARGDTADPAARGGTARSSTQPRRGAAPIAAPNARTSRVARPTTRGLLAAPGVPMSLLRLFFSFRGRASRGGFWLVSLTWGVLGFVLDYVWSVTDAKNVQIGENHVVDAAFVLPLLTLLVS